MNDAAYWMQLCQMIMHFNFYMLCFLLLTHERLLVVLKALDRQVASLGGDPSSSQQASLDACLGEVEDLLTYCDDVMATGVML